MATKPKAKAKTSAKTTPGADSATAILAMRSQATALRDQAEALIAIMNHLWGPAPAPGPGGGLTPKAASGPPPSPAVGGSPVNK